MTWVVHGPHFEKHDLRGQERWFQAHDSRTVWVLAHVLPDILNPAPPPPPSPDFLFSGHKDSLVFCFSCHRLILVHPHSSSQFIIQQVLTEHLLNSTSQVLWE